MTLAAEVVIRSRPMRVSEAVRVEFVYASGGASVGVTWLPSPPKRLAPRHIRRYQAVRDGFLRGVAAAIGRPIAVVDLEPGGTCSIRLIEPTAGGRA